jgi:small conductance mechanosensitive channel
MGAVIAAGKVVRAPSAISVASSARSSDEPCPSDDTGICGWVLEQTDNDSAAKAANWLLGVPLTIIAILLAAWLVRIIARRAIRRGTRRVMLPPESLTNRIGVLTGAGQVEGVAQEIEMARRRSRAESIGAALAGVVAVTIWIVALFSIASVLGVNLAPLLAGAGVAGVALGFGAQSLVRDCISGLFMLIEDQYGIGDQVDLGAASGTVERISLRTTVLRGADGTVWHVPNGEVRRVGNQSKLWSMAVVDVDVPVDADLKAARDHLLAAANRLCEQPEFAGDVLERPRVLGVESVRAEGVTLRLVVKSTPGRQWVLQRALREAIKHELDVNGIVHAMPPKS